MLNAARGSVLVLPSGDRGPPSELWRRPPEPRRAPSGGAVRHTFARGRGPRPESSCGVQPGARAGRPGAGLADRRASRRQLRSSYRFSDPGLSELPLEALLDELLVRVQEALEVDTVAILLYDAEADQLVARAAKGIEEEVEQGVRIPLGRGFAGRIAAERVAIFIADVDHADILNPILREKGIRVAARACR